MNVPGDGRASRQDDLSQSRLSPSVELHSRGGETREQANSSFQAVGQHIDPAALTSTDDRVEQGYVVRFEVGVPSDGGHALSAAALLRQKCPRRRVVRRELVRWHIPGVPGGDLLPRRPRLGALPFLGLRQDSRLFQLGQPLVEKNTSRRCELQPSFASLGRQSPPESRREWHAERTTSTRGSAGPLRQNSVFHYFEATPRSKGTQPA